MLASGDVSSARSVGYRFFANVAIKVGHGYFSEMRWGRIIMVTMRLYDRVTKNCIGKFEWNTDSENRSNDTSIMHPQVAKCWRLWSSSPYMYSHAFTSRFSLSMYRRHTQSVHTVSIQDMACTIISEFICLSFYRIKPGTSFLRFL